MSVIFNAACLWWRSGNAPRSRASQSVERGGMVWRYWWNSSTAVCGTVGIHYCPISHKFGKISSVSWGYIAGFFGGEGALVRRDDREGRGFRITVTQTNYTFLASIRKFTGAGTICRITKRKAHWKESWVCYISQQSKIYRFLQNILPFLVVKRILVAKAPPRLEEILRLQR